MDVCIPCLDPPLLPTEEGGGHLSPSSVILDTFAYISAAAVSNATTAAGRMTNGAPIEVSFCLARPPRLSYLCVHFPGPVLATHDGTVFESAVGTPAVRCVTYWPVVISTHADLALLGVTIPGSRDADYFVYTARPRPGASDLHRLPKPEGFGGCRDQDTAIVRCSDSRYVIAVLRNTLADLDFRLHLYDSDTQRWTSRLIHVQEPERDRVLPIPDSATELLFHSTTKTIVLGVGPTATVVGWVDLWRGILFCDVLDERPVLRDMPLPKPARCNRGDFCIGGSSGHRDITVVTLPADQSVSQQVNLVIKYVEMGSTRRPGPPSSSRRRQQQARHHSSSSSDDDDDVRDYWTATVWTMPVPIASWKDWRKDCTIDVGNMVIDNPRHCELLRALPGLTVDPEEAPAVTLSRLVASYPTLGLGVDGDVAVYFLSKVDCDALEGWVTAVGTKDITKLQGIAELDDRKNSSFGRFYRPTEISKYLTKATAYQNRPDSGQSRSGCTPQPAPFAGGPDFGILWHNGLAATILQVGGSAS